MHTQHYPVKNNRIKINWEGSLFIHHSLGMVNREILSELITLPHFDIRLIPFEDDTFIPDESSKFYPLSSISKTSHEYADIYIRHRWPPDFTRPHCRKFIVMQPWEYGSLPINWQKAMNTVIDEVWVYTRYLKTCYERSGINPDKVKVVPLGIDPALFNPSAVSLTKVTEKIGDRFCFMYNGGVTTRKGTDILVNAYLSEFTADESVCLFIKDSDIYQKGLAQKVKVLSERNDIASIIYQAENYRHEDLPGLYTSANCYVHPYRAEGYGLPIAEAMACGIPVVVTGGGACLDFVDPDCGYFVKCSLETMKTKMVSNLETVGYPFWLLPDMNHLRSVLRYVYNNQDKVKVIGGAASKSIRMLHTWEKTASIAAQRMQSILSPKTVNTPLPLDDDNKELMINQAVELLKQDKITEASSLFQKILLRYGENSLAYEGLGIAAFNNKNYNEACNLFCAANRISPLSVDIIINWYEAARIIKSEQELIQPIISALRSNNSSDELRAIAIEIGVL